MHSVSFYTIGCRLNQAETAMLQQSFERHGYKVVDFHDAADVVVINTCTVTQRGDADTKRAVNKVRRRLPDARIALIGCQAQTQAKELKTLPGVHWIVGNGAKMNLVKLLQETWDEPLTLRVPNLDRESFTLPEAGVDRQHTRANLKIQDGCDFFCTFCEIPYARGRARSRVFDDIVRKANELAGAGHKEIVLTGVNTSTYRYKDKTLTDVVLALENIDELERIRISSIEGKTIDERLLDHMSADSKLCRHLHISVQSASDTILNAMNRRYTVAEFSEFIHHVHGKVDNICLGTDILTGFPGETEQLFEETRENIQAMPLSYYHVFAYSDRKNARSRTFSNKVPRHLIDQRSQRLRELGQQQRRLHHVRNIGNIEKVLFEQCKNGWWTGLTDNYIRVRVQSSHNIHNQLLPVRLVKAESNSMTGHLL